MKISIIFIFGAIFSFEYNDVEDLIKISEYHNAVPSLIAHCLSEQEVQDGIEFCKNNNIANIGCWRLQNARDEFTTANRIFQYMCGGELVYHTLNDYESEEVMNNVRITRFVNNDLYVNSTQRR